MTKDEFRSRTRALGISLTDFATLTGVNRTTVNCWGGFRTGSFRDQDFPHWVGLLLAAWESDPEALLEAAAACPEIKLAVRLATVKTWAAKEKRLEREKRAVEE
jgi:hypothetical protein